MSSGLDFSHPFSVMMAPMEEPDDATDRRRPRSVYGVGNEPDPRVTLANERTALAWMRTALAVVAGGIALVLLEGALPEWRAVTWLPVVICLSGALLAVAGIVRWARVERAVRMRAPLPAPSTVFFIAALIVVVAVAVVIELWRLA